MKTGVSVVIQNYLKSIQENKDIIDGEYLNDGANINFIELVKHLYPGQTERAKLLNPGSHIGTIIADKIKNFVGEADVGDSKYEFNIDYGVVVESILTRGEILLKITNDSRGQILDSRGEKTDNLTLTEISPESYFFDGKKEFIIKLFQKIDDSNGFENINKYKQYLYLQTYEVQGDGKGILTNELFEVTGSLLSQGLSIPLSVIPYTAGLEPIQYIENLPRIVITIKVSKNPILQILKPLIYSIDRKLAEAEKNFVDYVEQFKIFQNIDIPKDAYTTVNGGKIIDWDKLGKIVKTSDYSNIGDIKIIKNTNDLLDKALLHVDKQLIQISNLTDIPAYYFGVGVTNGGDSGISKQFQASNFYKRITGYRDKIEDAIQIGFNILNTPEKSQNITWDSIIKLGEDDILANETIKLEYHMTSLIRAIKKVHDVDDEQAKLIIEEIKADKDAGLLINPVDKNAVIDTVNKNTARLNTNNN